MKVTIDVEGGKEQINEFLDALKVFNESLPNGFEVRVFDMELIYKDENRTADWED